MIDPVRTYHLPAATLREYVGSQPHLHTTLLDGSSCTNAPVWDSPDYRAAAAIAGYPTSRPGLLRYAVEHEISHHLVAERLFRRGLRPDLLQRITWQDPSADNFRCSRSVSRIIFNACHNRPQSMAEQSSKDEEHLVNRLQRWVNLGEPDPYNQLESTFGASLPRLAAEFLQAARPWLQEGSR